ILPPARAVLEQRLRGRGSETEDAVAKRLANARDELLQAGWFNVWIVNDDLEEAYQDLVAVYRAASLVPSRRPGFVAGLLKEWT
ncbi:MAG: guanylate kinase, partial [Deltaproteobacteria bacterium]|nr:guanylate kinase [Deltaproteobacteria bacterium]